MARPQPLMTVDAVDMCTSIPKRVALAVAVAALVWGGGCRQLLGIEDGTGRADAGAEHDAAPRPDFEWTDVTRATSVPEPRYGHAMAYDAARGRVVMFSGYTLGGAVDETWELDGSTWTEVTPEAESPEFRTGHAMAYDAAREQVVLFGGRSLDDTWVWDGTSWTDVTPEESPAGRDDTAMAYDAARERVVLFGGVNDSGALGGTWEWDGSAWTEVTPESGSPPPRGSHVMAYDAVRERVVLFGGAQRNDLWEWDGDAWTDITPEGPSPSARDDAAMAYDAAHERLVLFGGFAEDSGSGCTSDTWAFGDGGWTELTPDGESPEERDSTGMAYDTERERVVLFGGWPCRSLDALEDTWVGSFLAGDA